MEKVRQAVKTHGPTFVKIIVALLVLLVFYWAIFPSRSPNWTGFDKHPVSQTEALAKTLWDWLDLLFVPLTLGVAGYLLTKIQKDTESDIANKNRDKDLEIAREGRRQTAFENYLDRIKTLLLEKQQRSSDDQTIIDPPENPNIELANPHPHAQYFAGTLL
ncbi:MAG: hypothetical protein H6656_06250 [Ardenticatenaceae bacterium]|nr:hypothetical protein [Ardenticatenaceae bacterium]